MLSLPDSAPVSLAGGPFKSHDHSGKLHWDVAELDNIWLSHSRVPTLFYLLPSEIIAHDARLIGQAYASTSTAVSSSAVFHPRLSPRNGAEQRKTALLWIPTGSRGPSNSLQESRRRQSCIQRDYTRRWCLAVSPESLTWNMKTDLTRCRVSKLEFVQRLLWANAGFDALRKLDHLKLYTERWDVGCSIASPIERLKSRLYAYFVSAIGHTPRWSKS